MNDHLKALISESTKTALWESKDVQRVVLESRLAAIAETLELDETGWLDKARKWVTNKAYGAEQGARELGRKALVNPQGIVNDPRKALVVVQRSIMAARKSVMGFKQDALRSSTAINSLQDIVLDAFGKFVSLNDAIPQEQRGIIERDMMKIMSQFYLALMEEKKRIEVYLSSLARDVGAQGYNLGRSAQDMAGYKPAPAAQVQGSRVVEPETAQSPALAGAV